MDRQFINKIKRNDKIARWVITTGGISVILSVILIMFLIIQVALPLFLASTTEKLISFSAPEATDQVVVVGTDDYLENLYLLDKTGTYHVLDAQSGETIKRVSIDGVDSESSIRAITEYGDKTYSILWHDNSASVEQVIFKPHFDQDGTRTILFNRKELARFNGGGKRPLQTILRGIEGGSRIRVDLFSSSMKVTSIVVEEDFLGELEETRDVTDIHLPADRIITDLVMTEDGTELYLATEKSILHYDLTALEEPSYTETRVFSDDRSITSLNFVFGDISLIVGDSEGGISTWFPVSSQSSALKQLTRIHELSKHFSPVTTVTPSRRDKTILSLDVEGNINFDHMTSERHLMSVTTGKPISHYQLSSRGNGLVALDESNTITLWQVDNPHPEMSFSSLFRSVWYESYHEPDYVWQSSSSSDDFEPKFSLTPLIFGTLKGTFYAMIFAIPLALAGAIYTSSFCSPRVKSWIKPTIEIMAAVPSVVIGFLAALWLAPLIESFLVTLGISLILIPLFFLGFVFIWYQLSDRPLVKKMGNGREFLSIAPAILISIWLGWLMTPGVEAAFFDGNIKLWLFEHFDIRYDQRNAIIIAFGLGFAVIPIIFSIAEDALSNVPPSLKAASLALGASRWQTVWKVILPSASPGIFAGIMIGLGRAIGETMIVLMATGNTAILDMSIFNGMRPLSANIAVEIPEAPVGGTLYRTLFLSAVILFAMTFFLNTIAEVVRQRLRNKYGKFQ